MFVKEFVNFFFCSFFSPIKDLQNAFSFYIKKKVFGHLNVIEKIVFII